MPASLPVGYDVLDAGTRKERLLVEGGEDQVVKGMILHEQPVLEAHNKFVITEDKAWFLPFEDNAVAPTLGEIIAAVVDLSDPEIQSSYDQRIEDGLVFLGYVDKETRIVSIHVPDEPLREDMRVRLDQVFGEGTTYG